MAKRKPKGSWIVRVKVVSIRELVCDDCTEEQARDNPYDHAVSDDEVHQEDWQIQDIKPNN